MWFIQVENTVLTINQYEDLNLTTLAKTSGNLYDAFELRDKLAREGPFRVELVR
jgi:hypothetical protein